MKIEPPDNYKDWTPAEWFDIHGSEYLRITFEHLQAAGTRRVTSYFLPPEKTACCDCCCKKRATNRSFLDAAQEAVRTIRDNQADREEMGQ